MPGCYTRIVYAVPAHPLTPAECSDWCSVLNSFLALHRSSSSGESAWRRVRWDRAQRRLPETSPLIMRAVRRPTTFNGGAKISVLRMSAACCAMRSRLWTLAYPLPGIRTQDIAAQPSSREAYIVSARAPETGFFAFWLTPLCESRKCDICEKQVLNDCKCIFMHK